MQSICVFLGATEGNNSLFTHAAIALGHELAARKITLVYGGSSNGLMGKLADAALNHGGKVVGVMSRSLLHKETLHPNVTTMHLTDTIQERKKILAELADGFIAMPGGLGTLEEIFEVWSAVKVGHYKKPFGFLSVDGYFNELMKFLAHAVKQGLITKSQFELAEFHHHPATLVDQITCKYMNEVI